MSSKKRDMSGGAKPHTLSIIAAGDTFLTRRPSKSVEPALLRLRDIIQGADVACVNLEGPMREPSAYPVKQYCFSTYFTTEQWLADELRWIGFNMVALANNHMSDWSFESIITNQRLLRKAGIVSAGAGMSLSEAREPAYLDLPNCRVALVSVDSSYEHNELLTVQMASDPRGSIRGRPGLNGLPWHRSVEVDGESIEALRRIRTKLGLHVINKLDRARADAGELPLFEVFFRESAEFCVKTWCDEQNLGDVLRWIDCAKSQSDYVIVMHHSHGGEGDLDRPPKFAREFAHAAIDAGCDMYVGTGYYSQGVEIYNERPIFHNTGQLANEVESQRRHPSDTYDHWGLDSRATPADLARTRRAAFELPGIIPISQLGGYLPRVTFENSRLTEARVIPVTMTSGRAFHHRGTPLLAEGDVAVRILSRVVEASRLFGTEIDASSGEIDCRA